MLEARRIHQNTKPSKIEYLGRNKYYYNYDIQEEQVDNEGTVETHYNFVQVKLSGKPDYKRCVQAVIRQYVSLNEEFDLINTYNLNIINGERDINKDYQQYLALVNTIKNNIKQDFK